MPTLAQANVEITARTGKYKASIAGVRRQTEGFGKSATKSLRNVTLGLAAMGTAAAAAAVAIGVKLAKALIQVGRATIQTAIKYDKLKIGLIAVTGSAEEAEKQLKRLRVVSELPGLSFEQAIQGSINLQAAGLSAGLAERSLKAFGNALAVVGKGAPELAGVSLALTQIANKTSGFGQDIRQLQERLPQMQTALKNAFDGKPIEDLNITGKELIAALVVEFEKLATAGQSVGNDIVNLGTSFDILKKSIGDKLLKATGEVVTGLDDIVKKLTIVIESYEEYRVEAARVFREVGIIGIRLTGQLFLSMTKIVASVAKIIWVPLKFEMLRTMQDVNDAVELGIIKMMGTIREFFGGDAEIARLQKQTVGTSRIAWDIWFRQMQSAEIDIVLVKELKNIEDTAVDAFDKIIKAFTAANKALDPLVNKIKEAEGGIAGIEEEVFDFGKVVGDLDLSKPFEGFAKTFSQFRIEQLGERLAEAFRNAGKQSEFLKSKLRELNNEMSEIEDKMSQALMQIETAIADTFERILTGNTKNIWQQFWNEMKRIAIRTAAEISAAALLTSIFGTGTALAGFGTLAPVALPLLAGAGIVGGMAHFAGDEGRTKQPVSNTFVFNETDFANMDRNRLQKTVSQEIAPALAENAVDGR
jgi:tape measure domain-containing protein